jgi:formylglycine-generating enzyme required for sulfatase activity
MLKKLSLACCGILIMVNGVGPQLLTAAQQSQPVKDKIVLAVEEIKRNMVYVQGGTFTMGCAGQQGGNCYATENPEHSVTISSFSISKYLVTQALWKAIMDNNPSNFKNCDNCPVETVSWIDAQKFISKLNSITGQNYRLPTEAEWEYAARGGNKTGNYTYPGDNNIDAAGWYAKNSGGKTHPVGQKLPNELGLYDMAGNVMQWCADWHDSYSSDLATNPKGPLSGQYRALRGCSWIGNGQNCRVADRDSNTPDRRDNIIGFRLARD